MEALPCLAFILPFVAEAWRNGIGKTKGDKIDRAFLLPVRKAGLCLANCRVGIEEAQLGVHGRIAQSYQFDARCEVFFKEGGFQAVR